MVVWLYYTIVFFSFSEVRRQNKGRKTWIIDIPIGLGKGSRLYTFLFQASREYSPKTQYLMYYILCD